MKNVFDVSAREELIDRLATLEPSAERQWGSLTSSGMLAHLADALRMTWGEVLIAPRGGPLRWAPVRKLVIHVAPFPKGAPTAPELISREATDWDAERAVIVDRLGRFAGTTHTLYPEHPAFGRMTEKDWGVLVYRHMDHHFRQFGV